MEFLSKYTAGLSRAFVAFLRLFKIQDTLSLVSHLTGKRLQVTQIYLSSLLRISQQNSLLILP